jgi:ABC-2 type transport system permease protein
MTTLVAASAGLAVFARLLQTRGVLSIRINDVSPGGSDVLAAIVWLLFVRFIVPVLGVFYGTSLIADEVEEKTITYLFTRPIRRSAVVIGKYLAYLAATASVLLPTMVIVYFLVVAFRDVPSTFAALVKDVGILAIGLATYGALFTLAGVALNKPLVVGLLFVFGWEQIALVMPGSVERLTIAYHLQELIPHAIPSQSIDTLFPPPVRNPQAPWISLLWLSMTLVISLSLAMAIVERREYVLEE